MTIRFHRIKPSGPDHAGLSRRMFLMTTTMAGVTTGAMLGGTRAAFASALTNDEQALLLQVVQDIYPHPDLLKLAHYEAIVDTLSKSADDDAATAADMANGLERIEAQAKALFGTSYRQITDPDAREAVLRKFQHDGFFQSMRWTAYFAIYDNKEIWPLFGYEGSSVEHGGYIDRGFSDITFVPQGPTLEQRLAEVQG